MKPNPMKPLMHLLTVFFVIGSFHASAQLAMNVPKPAGGTAGWTAICAGIGGFNEYNATISWAGAPNANNEFILELSDASGNFANPVELARVNNQNTNTAKEFDVQFAIPTDTQGNGYKLRARSTNPVSQRESTNAYNMYYMAITTNLNISELGNGVPPGDICSANPITLRVDNVPSPENQIYLWYRSGTLLPETGHQLTVTQSGMYQAFVDYGTICSGSANTDSNIVTVTIGTTGSAVGINPPANTALCAGDTVTLSIDTTDPAWSYQWYKNGTAIAGATATTYTVNASLAGFEGDYQVEISGTGICTQRSIATAITNADNFTVTRINPAAVVVLPSQTQTLSVTTNAVSPSYQWYRNGSVVAAATNSSLNITQDGTYYCSVTQSGGTCPGTVKNSDTTVATIPASFEIIVDYGSTYSACLNTSIPLTLTAINAVASNGSITDVTTQLQSEFTYQWQKDGANVAGATSTTLSLNNTTHNGTYLLNAELSTYAPSSNTLPVQLLTNENLAITSNETVYCNPSQTITINTTTNLTSTIFRWERNGTSVNTTDNSLNVTQTGTYRLVLDRNGCDLVSNEIEITTLDPDLITFDIVGDVIFPEGSSKTVTASGGDGYTWYNSDNATIGTGDSFNFTTDGSYYLTATIGNCEVTKPITAVYLDLFNIPNVITPNGDGSNDLWVLPNSYSKKNDVQVIIFDNNGGELLRETNYQNNWPSSSLKFPKQNMVFYYVISNTTEILKKGTITVIR